MRCLGCDYELWNLAPGACPECGRVWSFEERRFRAQAARFLCPHCDHAYAGTDQSGLPTPRVFVCVNCQQEISLSNMRALPAPGTDGSDAMQDQHPWFHRGRVGRFRAFRQTTRESLLRPSALAASLPAKIALKDALLYSVLCGSTAVVGCVAAPIILMMILEGRALVLEVVLQCGIALAVTIGVAIAFQLVLVLWGIAAHALLKATGPVGRSWRTTTCALLYSSAPLLFAALPCCGVYVSALSLLWMMITAIVAVVASQRVSGGRAAFAVLTPALTLLGSLVALIIWVVLATMNVSFGAAPPATTTPPLPSAITAPADPATPADPSDSQTLPAP